MEGEVTFVLTNGGHNAGVVSEPGHPGRSYRVATRAAEDLYVDPTVWNAKTPRKEGSWWPEWAAWLGARSSEATAPPVMGGNDPRYVPLADAPGEYVKVR